MNHAKARVPGVGFVGLLLGCLLQAGCGGGRTAHMVPVPPDSNGEEEGAGREQKGPELPTAELKDELLVDAAPDASEGRLAESNHETPDLTDVQDTVKVDQGQGFDLDIDLDVPPEVDEMGDIPADDKLPDVCLPDCVGKECGPDGCGGDCGVCGQGVCIKGKCPPAGKECEDGNDVDWDGCTKGQLSEFQVNQYTQGWQLYPSVAVGKDGDFLVGWRGNVQFLQGTAVVLRMYNETGEAAVNEFPVSPSFVGQQTSPEMTAMEDGTFVVVWSEIDLDESFSVKGRLVSPDGNPKGQTFPVNTTSGEHLERATVAPIGSGGFVVAWTDWKYIDMSSSSSLVRAQVFDAAGQKLGSEVLVWGAQSSVNDVSAGPADGGLVALSFYSGPTAKNDVVLLGLDSGGVPVGMPTQVNQYTGDDQANARLALVSGGPLVAVWMSKLQDGSQTGVYGRLAEPTGKPLGDEFQVNPEGYGPQSQPDVVSPAGDRFAVAWDGQGFGDEGGVFLRLFSTSAAPLTGEIPVNKGKAGKQMMVRLASGEGSPIVAVWQRQEPGGDSDGIFARRFDIDGNPLYH